MEQLFLDNHKNQVYPTKEEYENECKFSKFEKAYKKADNESSKFNKLKLTAEDKGGLCISTAVKDDIYILIYYSGKIENGMHTICKEYMLPCYYETDEKLSRDEKKERFKNRKAALNSVKHEVKILSLLKSCDCTVNYVSCTPDVFSTPFREIHRVLRKDTYTIDLRMEYGLSYDKYFDWLNEKYNNKIPIDVALNVCYDLFYSLKELHSKRIEGKIIEAHSDIKPANIILVERDMRYRPVFIDFDVARTNPNIDSYPPTGYSPDYASLFQKKRIEMEKKNPELSREELDKIYPIGERSDVVSMAKVVQQMLNKNVPSPDNDPEYSPSEELTEMLRECDDLNIASLTAKEVCDRIAEIADDNGIELYNRNDDKSSNEIVIKKDEFYVPYPINENFGDRDGYLDGDYYKGAYDRRPHINKPKKHNRGISLLFVILFIAIIGFFVYNNKQSILYIDEEGVLCVSDDIRDYRREELIERLGLEEFSQEGGQYYFEVEEKLPRICIDIEKPFPCIALKRSFRPVKKKNEGNTETAYQENEGTPSYITLRFDDSNYCKLVMYTTPEKDMMKYSELYEAVNRKFGEPQLINTWNIEDMRVFTTEKGYYYKLYSVTAFSQDKDKILLQSIQMDNLSSYTDENNSLYYNEFMLRYTFWRDSYGCFRFDNTILDYGQREMADLFLRNNADVKISVDEERLITTINSSLLDERIELVYDDKDRLISVRDVLSANASADPIETIQNNLEKQYGEPTLLASTPIFEKIQINDLIEADLSINRNHNSVKDEIEMSYDLKTKLNTVFSIDYNGIFSCSDSLFSFDSRKIKALFGDTEKIDLYLTDHGLSWNIDDTSRINEPVVIYFDYLENNIVRSVWLDRTLSDEFSGLQEEKVKAKFNHEILIDGELPYYYLNKGDVACFYRYYTNDAGSVIQLIRRITPKYMFKVDESGIFDYSKFLFHLNREELEKIFGEPETLSNGDTGYTYTDLKSFNADAEEPLAFDVVLYLSPEGDHIEAIQCSYYDEGCDYAKAKENAANKFQNDIEEHTSENGTQYFATEAFSNESYTITFFEWEAEDSMFFQQYKIH